MNPVLMAILTTRPIEDLFGYAMSSKRAYDTGLITRQPAISSTPQTITVTSDIGPSGSRLAKAYSSSKISGEDKMPDISWTAATDVAGRVKEWVVVAEDPDAPVGEPIVHGIYYGISKSRAGVVQKDFEREGAEEERRLAGGFWYGKSRTGDVYIAPRPIARHGEHRYFFSVIGLSSSVDWADVRGKAEKGLVDKKSLLQAVEGKVVGWGEWIGTFERL